MLCVEIMRRNGRVAAVIGFDLDGTLIDSSASIKRAMSLAYTNVTHEFLDVGCVVPGAPLQHMLLGLDLSREKRLLVMDEFKKLYDGGICHDAKVYDGIIDALIFLAGQTELYIVTNKRKKIAESILDRLSLRAFFKAVEGQSEGKYQPKEAILLRTLSRLGVSGGVYIGDTQGDVEAARALELTPIFCSWGYSDSAYKPPCRVISSPADLTSVLGK